MITNYLLQYNSYLFINVICTTVSFADSFVHSFPLEFALEYALVIYLFIFP